MPASIKHLTNKKLNLTSLLAKWKDGLYYTAAVIKCDKVNKKCLVCFEDGSEIWVTTKDVHIQLTLDQVNQDDDIVCCLCDDGSSESPNEIILCDVCQQGYHQKCHNPPVDSSTIDGSDDNSDHKDWFCATCSYILNQSDRDKLTAKAKELEQMKIDDRRKEPVSQRASRSAAAAAAAATGSRSMDDRTSRRGTEPVKQQPKVKSVASGNTSETTPKKTLIGSIKSTPNSSHRQAPYYPLSNQVRVAATSAATAALASMTANSAMVVGGSSGRTKQDLVNQSYKSTQQRHQPSSSHSLAQSVDVVSSTPMKNAVRKSGMNFPSPVRQSALPVAIRSPITTTPQNIPTVSTTIISPKLSHQPLSPQVVSSTSPVTNSGTSNEQLLTSSPVLGQGYAVGSIEPSLTVSIVSDKNTMTPTPGIKQIAAVSNQADSQSGNSRRSPTSPSSTTCNLSAAPSKSVSCALLTSKLVTLDTIDDQVISRGPVVVSRANKDMKMDASVTESSCGANVSSTNNNDDLINKSNDNGEIERKRDLQIRRADLPPSRPIL